MTKKGEIIKFLDIETSTELVAFHWCGSDECTKIYDDIIVQWRNILGGNV